MPRRTLLVTAVPIAIILVCGMIGVVASRLGDDPNASGAAAEHDLPFAIAEPVAARWQANAAASATFTYPIAEPAAGAARTYKLSRQRIDLDDTQDVRIGPSRSIMPDNGFLVNNGSRAQRILIDGLVASDCTEYGGYIDGAEDWWIRNSMLHQAKDATQHGLRIASGVNIRISDTVIDSRQADKTSLWVLEGENIELRNVKLLGGRSWFSIAPDNPDLPDGSVRNVIIADCWIDCDQDWPNPLEFMPGVDGVTITNLHVRSGKPPIGVWSSIDGVAAARTVKWKDIWVPAPDQPADTPFDDLRWVKLRDDDWERIITHKGSTREEVLSRGIGPLESAPR